MLVSEGGIVTVGAGNVGRGVGLAVAVGGIILFIGVQVIAGSKGLQHVALMGGAQTVMMIITVGAGAFCGLSAAGGWDSLPFPLALGAGLAGRFVGSGRGVRVGVRVGVPLAVGLGPGLAVKVIDGVAVLVADGIGGRRVKNARTVALPFGVPLVSLRCVLLGIKATVGIPCASAGFCLDSKKAKPSVARATISRAMSTKPPQPGRANGNSSRVGS